MIYKKGDILKEINYEQYYAYITNKIIHKNARYHHTTFFNMISGNMEVAKVKYDGRLDYTKVWLLTDIFREIYE
jgi:hypothetical protein